MDKIFSGLFGGGDDDTDDTRTQRAGDFVNRVESGNPMEGFSTAEALQNYKQVASKLPEDEYVSAARDALSRFTPQQRQEFGQLLSQKTGANIQGDIDSPEEIAQLTNRLRSDQGNPLGALLGGSGGLDDIIGALSGGGGSGDIMGALSGLLGGGKSASSASGEQTSGIADLLKNPIVQAVLAAIAAAAMKKYGAGGGGLSGLFGGESGQQVAGATSPQNPAIGHPTRGSEGHSGGGLLDTLFGGGDRDTDSGSKVDELRDLEKNQKPKSL